MLLVQMLQTMVLIHSLSRGCIIIETGHKEDGLCQAEQVTRCREKLTN